jgi:hypothetical protein
VRLALRAQLGAVRVPRLGARLERLECDEWQLDPLGRVLVLALVLALVPMRESCIWACGVEEG